jgi:hypothetical protein
MNEKLFHEIASLEKNSNFIQVLSSSLKIKIFNKIFLNSYFEPFIYLQKLSSIQRYFYDMVFIYENF